MLIDLFDFYNRCSNCFDCPSCGHTLTTRATSTSVPDPEDPNKTTPRKMYYMVCGFCRWTTRDVGIQDKSVGQWIRLPTSTLKEQLIKATMQNRSMSLTEESNVNVSESGILLHFLLGINKSTDIEQTYYLPVLSFSCCIFTASGGWEDLEKKDTKQVSVYLCITCKSSQIL